MHMFIALAVLLGAAKFAGELMQKLDQPSVLGEIMAGILLGPTVLGHFRPDLYAFIFPTTGNLPIVLETVDHARRRVFSAHRRTGNRPAKHLPAGQERAAGEFLRRDRSLRFWIRRGGIISRDFWARPSGADRLIFALFVGTALSISALPVIAKILMDLNLLRS